LGVEIFYKDQNMTLFFMKTKNKIQYIYRN